MTAGSAIVRRLLRLALAASLLASSSFHFHGTDSAGEQSRVGQRGVQLRSAESHPTSPPHIESVKLERAPRCLECLLRQKDHAFGAPVFALPALLEPTVHRTASDPGRLPLRRAGDPGRPRGPPLL